MTAHDRLVLLTCLLESQTGSVQVLNLNISPLQVIPLLGFPAMF
nr:MAG TPA: hypothetical protein [Caudoviricetes sp.]